MESTYQKANVVHRAAVGGLCVLALATMSAAHAGEAGDTYQGQASLETTTPRMPSVEDVFVLMRDMQLPYESVQVRTIVPASNGASILVVSGDGTLMDVELVAVRDGWTLRDIFYIAGNAGTFHTFTEPWQRRVREAQRFLNTSPAPGRNEPSAQRRRAEELAALLWFEDPDQSSRLWGLNPTTYRVMKTLKMIPGLGGPMNSGQGRRE